MSFKDLKEKREFEINVRRTVCDICGEFVKDGTVRLYLGAIKEEAKDYLPRKGDNVIDVCSVRCLKEIINGIALMFDSKVVPATLENHSTDNTGLVLKDSETYAKERATQLSFWRRVAREIKFTEQRY